MCRKIIPRGWFEIGCAIFSISALGLVFFALSWMVINYEPDREISSRWENFKLLRINPPKHFYVSLESESGHIFNDIFVSKHCNNWRQLEIGQTLRLEVKMFQQPGTGKSYEQIMVRDNRVCPR